MPLSKAVLIFVEQTKDLRRQHDAEINQQWRITPRILDGAAFTAVKRKLTLYALDLSSQERSATKRIADNVEEGKEEEFNFDVNRGCTFGCELPARFSLPCRHWMYASIIEECPFPLSLFHPRWHFDGPAALHDPCIITWNPEQQIALGATLVDRHAGDRYAARGKQMAEESALAFLNKFESLPPGMAGSFAGSFSKGVASLLAQQDAKLATRDHYQNR
jgi:hypothetical protein